MADRGEYRSFFLSFWDDPDEHALSDRAYRVLTTLKGTLPPSGIGVVYVAQLAERCRATPKQIEAALIELETPKPGQGLGWIVRERNIIWIVNALRYEPNLYVTNEKHRTFVAKMLLPLGDRASIVDQFRDYYADWFPERASNNPDNRSQKHRVSDTPAEDSDTVSDRVSKHIDVDVAVNRDGYVSRDVAVAVDAAAAIATTDAPVVLVAAANRGIRERFGEQPSPIRHDAGSTHHAVEQITSAGVPIAFARDAIYTAAKECSLDRAPRSLKYFVGYAIDRWQASQEHAIANGSAAKALVSTNGTRNGESGSFLSLIDTNAKGAKHA